LDYEGYEAKDNRSYWSAIQRAAENGHYEVIDLLIKSGVDVNGRPAKRGGRTALQAAALPGHLEVVNQLLDSGADVHYETSKHDGRTAL
jgi:ankyrin repeat protein